jgi:hypothetical protein
MKRSLLFLMVCLWACAGVYAQKVKPVEYGGSINLIRADANQSSITVRVLGYGKNEATAREDAEVRAIRAVLYVGFQNCSALVKESEAEGEHAAYFSRLFDDKRYKDFISGVVGVGDLTKVKGQKVKQMPFDMTINRKALRQDLVQNKIGRLGFGR